MIPSLSAEGQKARGTSQIEGTAHQATASATAAAGGLVFVQVVVAVQGELTVQVRARCCGGDAWCGTARAPQVTPAHVLGAGRRHKHPSAGTSLALLSSLFFLFTFLWVNHTARRAIPITSKVVITIADIAVPTAVVISVSLLFMSSACYYLVP